MKGYGLEFNQEKTVHLQVSTQNEVTRSGGEWIEIVTEVAYLGGLITQDCRVRIELTGRLVWDNF
eukprot:3184235-Pyramimonas_sp.AAC.1